MNKVVIGKAGNESSDFLIYYEPEKVELSPRESPVEIEVCVSSCPLCARPVSVDRWYTMTCISCRAKIQIATT